jgi:hypothetical protein
MLEVAASSLLSRARAFRTCPLDPPVYHARITGRTLCLIAAVFGYREQGKTHTNDQSLHVQSLGRLGMMDDFHRSRQAIGTHSSGVRRGRRRPMVELGLTDRCAQFKAHHAAAPPTSTTTLDGIHHPSILDQCSAWGSSSCCCWSSHTQSLCTSVTCHGNGISIDPTTFTCNEPNTYILLLFSSINTFAH